MQFGPGLLPTFLYYFSSTALVFALVTILGMDQSLSTGAPQQMGLLGGLVGGILGAYFNRTIKLELPVESEKKFLKKLEGTLTQLGYEKKLEEDGVRTYERSGTSKFLSGRIYVAIENGTATIASRATQIRRLRKLL